MPCHLPSQFLQFCVNGIDSIRVSLFSLLLPQCESSFSPTHTYIHTYPCYMGLVWPSTLHQTTPFSCFEELSSRPLPKKVSSYWGKQTLIATHVKRGLGLGLARFGFGCRNQIWHGRFTQDKTHQKTYLSLQNIKDFL
jgi:hypothetical protein